jgi:hypothetical protein
MQQGSLIKYLAYQSTQMSRCIRVKVIGLTDAEVNKAASSKSGLCKLQVVITQNLRTTQTACEGLQENEIFESLWGH